MSEYRRADVYVQDEYAGSLSETEAGYKFEYDGQYLSSGKPAVSITLPLSEKPYESPVLFPFFDGLIPEGWLLDVVIHNWKLNADDRFGILLASCGDCIGDVTVKPEVRL